jgi:hypothetical protein
MSTPKPLIPMEHRSRALGLDLTNRNMILIRHGNEMLRLELGYRRGEVRLSGPATFEISRHWKPGCCPEPGAPCDS